jgi:hypothetical protein
MLRIVIGANRSDVDTITSLGHELQHAVEVLSRRDVKTAGQMVALYQFAATELPRARARFETEKAIETGNAVREEFQAAGH